MKCTVTGLSVETNGITEEQLTDSKIFSGKNAGICYMGDSYFDSNVTDPDKALKRFISTANNAHHSITDHIQIEVLFEGCSKMLAIVLNSLQNYATSEKSGRYTVMTGNSEEEQKLYEKWCDLFQKRITELYPTIDDSWLRQQFDKKYPNNGYEIRNGERTELEPCLDTDTDRESYKYFYNTLKVSTNLPSRKLAQENARYILSVFTKSTTLGYSTSLRQWNYIYDWCIKYINQYRVENDAEYAKVLCGDNNAEVTLHNIKTGSKVSYFERRLYFELLELSNYIYETFYVEELRDTKDRCFDFLTMYSGCKDNHPMSYYDLSVFEPDGYTGDFVYTDKDHSKDDHLGITYNIAYTASFAQIAQAERHRTLKYFMLENFSFTVSDFFTPPCIKGTDLEQEWLEDLHSVAHLIPQATKVGIIEMGSLDNFVLKCKERLCGRAQWETMNQTKLTAQRFIDAYNEGVLPSCAKPYVEQLISDLTGVTTKCQLCNGCKESCYFGARKALERLI